MSGSIKWDKDENAHYYLDGKEVPEADFRKAFPEQEGVPGGHPPSCWPMTSEALACHESQVAEMNERNRAAGVSTRYKEDGTAVIPDRADRRKLLKLEGYHDRDGGYSDG